MSKMPKKQTATGLTRAQRRRRGIIWRWILGVILIAFAIFPVIWVVSASFNPAGTLSAQSLIPRNAGFDNYHKLLTSDVFPFWRWFSNSLKIASITTIGSVSITTLGAYAFSRFRFSGRENMLRAILLIQIFPGILAIVAVFLLITQFGSVMPRIPAGTPEWLQWLLGAYVGDAIIGLDTHTGLILVYLGGAMGINIWLMKGFFDTIPRAIDESAKVDGATHWQIFTKLLLPLMRPILVVIAILTFIGVYGDFVLARVLLKDTQQYTLMVGLFIFTAGQFSQQWGQFTAGALIGAAPIMVVYLALQDQIVGGLTQGSVKG